MPLKLLGMNRVKIYPICVLTNDISLWGLVSTSKLYFHSISHCQ